MSSKKTLMISLVFLVPFAGMALAQPGPIGENILVKVRNGEEAQWEAAYKQHLAWHSGFNDTWGWTTYQFMSGPNVGDYMVRTGGHEWKDFDDRGDTQAKDVANYNENAGKHTESYYVWYDRIHRDLSRIPEGGGPYEVLEFTRVFVKPSKVPQFMGVIAKFHAAFEKTDSPANYAIASTETGGSTSNFLFVGLHKSFASLEEPPDSMPKMMEEVYGGMQAAEIFDEFWECVDRMESNLAVLREDLTYRGPSSTSNQ